MTLPRIAGLDLSAKIFTLAVGELPESKRLVIRAVESIPAQGIQRGGLSDPIEFSDAVARLVRQAEKSISGHIPSVYATLLGNHCRSFNAAASIPIPDPNVGVSPRDAERVVNTCRTLSLDYDRQILHSFPRGFSVDGQGGIKDPVGLFGTKLSVELHLVTALNLGIQNLTRVLNRAGLEVEQLLIPGVAVAEAVLPPLDKELGVTLIWIGDFRTEALLFTDGSIRETLLIPWGADPLADGLSRSLKLPLATAEQLLEQVQRLEPSPSGGNGGLTLPLRVQTGSVVRSVPAEQVIQAVGARVKEFLNRLRKRLQETEYFRESAAGIVVVGPLARWEGFLELAESLLNVPVRMGVLQGIGTAKDLEVNPQVTLRADQVAAIGLLKQATAQRGGSHRSLPAPGLLRWVERGRRLLEEYF